MVPGQRPKTRENAAEAEQGFARGWRPGRPGGFSSPPVKSSDGLVCPPVWPGAMSGELGSLVRGEGGFFEMSSARAPRPREGMVWGGSVVG